MANIAFRVDIAKHIGTGHWQRCLTLARYLLTQGCQISFFYRDFGEDFRSLQHEPHIHFICIGKTEVTGKTFASEHDWLGVHQAQDSRDFLNAIQGQSFDSCVIDHYAISEVWERDVRRCIPTIMVIDDLANRAHDCDVLLDQNVYQHYDTRYAALTGPSSIQLLGPTYSLLRDEFFALRQQFVEPKPNQILVNFGGVGHIDLLKKALYAMIVVPTYQYVVITGQLSDEQFDALTAMSKAQPIQLLKSTTAMAKLMQQSAFALGACGATVWERFCLGLNAALIQMADNQAESLAYLSQQQLVDNLGCVEAITTHDFIEFLKNLDLNSPTLRQRRQTIQQLVDGLGAKKVGDILMEQIQCR